MILAKKFVTILCDDIRREVGGKASLIGVYNDVILVSAIPHIFSKLCLFVMLTDVNYKIMPAKLSVRVVTHENEPIELEMDFATPKQEGEAKNANIGIELSPFHVKCAGETKFEIRINDQEKPVIIHKVLFKTK